MEKLHFILDRIYQMTSIPIRYMDVPGNITLLSLGYNQAKDPAQNPELKGELLWKARSRKQPILIFEEENIVYGAMSDTLDGVIILGPIALHSLTEKELQRYFSRKEIQDTDFHIVKRTIVELCSSMSTLYFVCTGLKISEIDIIANMNANERLRLISADEYQRYHLESEEEEIIRLGYSDEILFLQQIKDGDVTGLLRGSFPQGSENRIGRLAQSPLKQFEYMVCTSLALVSRSAIEAGLDPSVAYPLSDLYLKKLENCKTLEDMLKLHMDFKINFATLVKNYKHDRAQKSYIEACKVYITNHVNKSFSLDDLANHIGVNKSYLSRNFAKDVGLGIHKYTQLKRIEAACNMLKYSDTELSIIAEYLCFSSQSHFGKIFKQTKGVTPQKYRQNEKLNGVHFTNPR